MGIIARQGVSNGFAIFLGFFLGGINTVFIFPYVFRNNLNDLGLIQLLVTISLIAGQLLTFGSVGITIRYFPKMQSENRLGQLLFYIWVLPSLALFLFGIFLLFFGNEFMGLFINETTAVSLTDAAIILFFLTISMTFFRIFAGYSTALKKTFLPSFLNEVFIRIIILIIILLYYLKYINVLELTYLHILAYFMPVLLILFYLRKSELFKINVPNSKEFKEIFYYGFYTWMDLIATWIVNRIDTIMIASLLFLSDVPIYNFAFYMSMVVALPNRSMILIAAPIIAESYHKKDMNNIQLIYIKSSIVQLLIGGFIFLLLWLNFDNILTFEPKEFLEAKMVFLYLGLSKLIDIFFSVNGTILVSSIYYRYNLFFNLILLVIIIITNLIFIPLMGIVGAAIATAISLTLFNIMKGVFLYKKYKLQPFHKNTLKGLAVLGLTFFAGYLLPVIDQPLLDIIVRSSVVAIVFIPAIIYFQISEDINDMFYKLVRRFFK